MLCSLLRRISLNKYGTNGFAPLVPRAEMKTIRD